MTQLDPMVQAQVDGQVLEQGAYAALELLIASGRLIYADYERWRRGEIEFLDGLLMGARQRIQVLLEQAAGYARSIGLVEQPPQEFHLWNATGAGDNSRTLRVSSDPNFDRLVAARYAPAQAAPQLDLFFDNPVVALTNGIVRALATGRLEDTRRQLDRLYTQAPNHPDLPAFDRLTAALERLGRPVASPREELKSLQELTPTARRLLGTQAGDLLAPLWRQLAEALSGCVYRDAEPDLHRSFALSQAQDWTGVRECIAAEAQWQGHPSLCVRMARSSFYLRDRIQALTAWWHLCWRHPERAVRELDDRRQPDAGVATAWARFQDSPYCDPRFHTADDRVAGDFPAWMLLQEPGLAYHLSPDLAAGGSSGEAHYRQVDRWLRARRVKHQEEELALRKAIRAASPALFECLKQLIH